ncbi:MAG: hypothetical protein HRU01_29685, partial [Myxococcales bacterium]|nr:hypothetical protein [Myxococcales bacterium]
GSNVTQEHGHDTRARRKRKAPSFHFQVVEMGPVPTKFNEHGEMCDAGDNTILPGPDEENVDGSGHLADWCRTKTEKNKLFNDRGKALLKEAFPRHHHRIVKPQVTCNGTGRNKPQDQCIHLDDPSEKTKSLFRPTGKDGARLHLAVTLSNETDRSLLRMTVKVPNNKAIMHNTLHAGTKGDGEHDHRRFFSYLDKTVNESEFVSHFLPDLCKNPKHGYESLCKRVPALKEVLDTGLEMEDEAMVPITMNDAMSGMI